MLRFGTMSTGGAGGLTVLSEWRFAVGFLTAVAAALLVLAVAFGAVALECADGRFLAVLMDRPSNKFKKETPRQNIQITLTSNYTMKRA